MSNEPRASPLTSRLRALVGTGATVARPQAGPRAAALPPFECAAAVLGAEVLASEGGSCGVVERRYAPDAVHGSRRIGDWAELARRSLEHVPVLAGHPQGFEGWSPPASMLFFDLETTGLAGGAGTYAFLIGCGAFVGDAFQTRQYFMTGFGAERSQLSAAAGVMAGANLLVSFNGRSFDGPLLETRYLFHRAAVPFADLPHLDMLHTGRRLWNRDEGCSLQALEAAIVGFERRGDVCGAEIPARYVHYACTGDPQPLVPVLEHNRLDLLSLAALTALAADLVRLGPAAARDARECLGLGRLYERAGAYERATVCFDRAVSDAETAAPSVRAEALVRLARRHRQARRYQEAADAWQTLVAQGAADPRLLREAARALAVHHEHRSKDLRRARTFALHAARASATAAARAAAHHRVARLERKIGGVHRSEGPLGAEETRADGGLFDRDGR